MWIKNWIELNWSGLSRLICIILYFLCEITPNINFSNSDNSLCSSESVIDLDFIWKMRATATGAKLTPSVSLNPVQLQRIFRKIKWSPQFLKERKMENISRWKQVLTLLIITLDHHNKWFTQFTYHKFCRYFQDFSFLSPLLKGRYFKVAQGN